MRCLFAQILACFLVLKAYADIGPEGFHKYRNRVFVETGTFEGNGIAKALQAGFQEIHSFDIDERAVVRAKEKYQAYPTISIYLGDTSRDLWQVIAPINEKITFWLDAHNIYPKEGEKNTAILEELDQIKRHPIKNHTILIDDMECLDTLAFDYIKRAQLIRKIKEINPKYKISYVNGGHVGSHKNNIMVATVK